VGIAWKAWLEADDILNARSAGDVLAFASARRDRARVTGPDADIPF